MVVFRRRRRIGALEVVCPRRRRPGRRAPASAGRWAQAAPPCAAIAAVVAAARGVVRGVLRHGQPLFGPVLASGWWGASCSLSAFASALASALAALEGSCRTTTTATSVSTKRRRIEQRAPAFARLRTTFERLPFQRLALEGSALGAVGAADRGSAVR